MARIKAQDAREIARAASGRRSHADRPNAVEPDEILEDAPLANAPDNKQINAVKDAAREQVKLKRAIERLETELKKQQALLNKNMMNTLPEAMTACRMDSFELTGGYKVKMDTKVFANVPQPDGKAENAEERHRIGLAKAEEVCPDLVEHSLTFYFQRGEEEKLFRKFLADLGKRKEKPQYVIKDTINASSLAKWVREQDKLAKTVPEKEFNVHRIKVAEVKIPKKQGIV